MQHLSIVQASAALLSVDTIFVQEVTNPIFNIFKNWRIMKQLFILATLMLLNVIGIQAQSLEGSWIAGEKFKEALALADEDADVDCLMDFRGGNVTLTVKVTAQKDDMTIVMAITYDGTFIRSGKNVATTIDKASRKFSILSMDSTDPETKEMLANEAMRKLVYTMIEEKAKDFDSLDQMDEIVDLIKSFEVKSVTANKLTISVEDEEMSFNRAN